jgi:hypothetical protein
LIAIASKVKQKSIKTYAAIGGLDPPRVRRVRVRGKSDRLLLGPLSGMPSFREAWRWALEMPVACRNQFLPMRLTVLRAYVDPIRRFPAVTR